MEKDNLIGKTEHVITQHEIDAWRRGQGDAAASKILKASSTLSVEQAISLVRMYAELGDMHFLAQRYEVTFSEVQKVLGAFGINSIEDAKQLVNIGVIAEHDAAALEQRDQDEINRKANEAKIQATMDAGVKSEPELSQEEKDLRLRARKEEAQTKNKRDQIRALIAEGIEVDVDPDAMKIPIALVGEFKSMIPHGVSALQRRFGGSSKDVKREIKRLSPSIDLDMLRP